MAKTRSGHAGTRKRKNQAEYVSELDDLIQKLPDMGLEELQELALKIAKYDMYEKTYLHVSSCKNADLVKLVREYSENIRLRNCSRKRKESALNVTKLPHKLPHNLLH